VGGSMARIHEWLENWGHCKLEMVDFSSWCVDGGGQKGWLGVGVPTCDWGSFIVETKQGGGIKLTPTIHLCKVGKLHYRRYTAGGIFLFEVHGGKQEVAVGV